MSHATVATAIRSFLGETSVPDLASSKWARAEMDQPIRATKRCKVNFSIISLALSSVADPKLLIGIWIQIISDPDSAYLRKKMWYLLKFVPLNCLESRAVDPDPDPYWIRIQLGLWIRILYNIYCLFSKIESIIFY